MSKIALEGNASGTGTFTIASPNSNSNYTLTLPSSTGTVVVTGGAQTIEFAAGTAASPSITFTGDTNTGIFSPAADTIAFAEGGAEAMRIDSSGNVGIGVTPAAWGSGWTGLQFGASGSVASGTYSSIGVHFSGNTYFDGTNWKYLVNGLATNYYQNAGLHVWRYAASGTAGNNITWTEAARITSGGYFKASNDGTYVDAAGAFHEFRQTSASVEALVVQASNASYTGGAFRVYANRNTSNGSFTAIDYYNSTAAEFRFKVYDSGQLMSVGSYNNTTASAANLFIAANYDIVRSTSSIKYKTQVENLDSSHADAILNFRPVWYRSLCNNDNANWSWYGLIAEEVAEIEPRLVHWGYSEEDYEVVETQEEVQKERTITGEDGAETVETYTETETKKNKQLKADAQLKPEGVQYDRLTVLLLDIVKRQDKRIEALEAEVAALKGQ